MGPESTIFRHFNLGKSVPETYQPPSLQSPDTQTLPVIRPEHESAYNLLRSAYEYGYSQESIAQIQKSLHLARAHQINEIEDRRLRKFDKVPYIEHPIDMAAEALRMRLDPTIAIAALAHDLAEDVKLGPLDNPEAWLKHIENEYADYSDKDRLLRILRAELKTESLSAQFPDEKEKRKVVNFYTSTSTGQTALGYLDNLRSQQEGHIHGQYSEEDKQKIAEVLFDLNNIFSESYVPNGKGGVGFDPSILIVKILDTWQNLKTPGFWGSQLAKPDKEAATVAKLVRARILTNVAEFFGMRRVASDMTQALATVHDINQIDFPGLKDMMTEGPNRVYFDRRMKTQKDAETEATNEERLVVEQLFKPREPVNEEFSTPRVEAVFQMPYGDPPNLYSDNIVFIVSNNQSQATPLQSVNNGTMFTNGVPLSLADGYLRPALLTTLGRETKEYLLYDRVRWPHANRRLRTTTKAPTIISSAKALEHQPKDNPLQIQHCPEYGLFIDGGCDYAEKTQTDDKPYLLRTKSGKLIDTRHTNRIDFLLSPHKYVSNGHDIETRPYVIIIRKKIKKRYYSEVYFANNKTDVTVFDIATRAGIKNPIVRALESDIWSKVVEGDHEVLNRMKLKAGDQEPQIGHYNVVVVEESA